MTHEKIMSQSIEVLDLDVRTYNALKRAGISTIADIENQAEKLEKTIPSRYKAAMGRLSEYEEIHTNVSCVENNTLSALPSPAQPEASVPTDKYAEAVQLNAQIMTSARAAQQNLYDMAMGFKKMRDDKLYKELGYDNFGDYCEGETGMKRRSVYGYISVVENLPSDFVQSTAQIGKEKLYLLSTIDEEHRTEIVENTDLESTTVKELREQIEQLKQSEAKTKSQLDAAEEQNAVLSAEKEQFHKASKANLEKLNEERERNSNLEQQIRELESRPVDVAVPDDEEIDRMARERAQGLLRAKDNEWQKRMDEVQLQLRKAEQAAFDAAFEANAPDTEQIREFYEYLHGNALSAIKSCFDFVRGDKVTGSTAADIKARLRTLKEIINDYLEEMK